MAPSGRDTESESQGIEGFWVDSELELDFRYPTPIPEVQLDHFLHRTRKLGILTLAC